MIRAKQIVDAPFESRLFNLFIASEEGWTVDLLSNTTIAHDGVDEQLDATQNAGYGVNPGVVGSSVVTELGIFDRVGNLFFEATVYLDETHTAVGASSAGAGVALYGTDGSGDISGQSRYEARIVSESDGGGDGDLFLYYGIDGASSLDLNTKLSSVSGQAWRVSLQIVAADTTNFVTFVSLNGEIRARDTEQALATVGLDVGTRPVLLSTAGDASRTNSFDDVKLTQLPSGGAGGSGGSGTLVVPTNWDAEIIDDTGGATGLVLLRATTPGGTEYEVELGEIPTAYIFDEMTDSDGTDITAHTIAPTNTLGASWVAIGGGFPGTTPTILNNAVTIDSTSQKGFRSDTDVGVNTVTVAADITAPAIGANAGDNEIQIYLASLDNPVTGYLGARVKVVYDAAGNLFSAEMNATNSGSSGATVNITGDISIGSPFRSLPHR